MRYTQEIILDLNPNSAPPIVYAKQGDVDTRGLTIYVTQNQEDYDLTANGVSSATLRIHKPDGTTSYVSDLPIPGSGNVIHIIFTEQSLLVSGRASADLLLSNENELLSSISFVLIIQPSPNGMRGIPSENEYNSFQDMLSKADEVTSAAKAWVVGPTPGSDYDTSSSSNNAKYWSDRAHDIVSSFEIGGVQLDIGDPAVPGTRGSIVKEDTNQFTFHAPTVNLHATATIASGSELGVTVEVQDYDAVEPPQESDLQKKFAFNFTLPSVEVSLSTTFASDDSGKAGDAAAIGSFVEAATTNIPLDNLVSNYVIPIEHGGIGVSIDTAASSSKIATAKASACTNIGAQRAIQVYSSSLAPGSDSQAWAYSGNIYSQTMYIPIGSYIRPSRAPEFIASPNSATGWSAAADVGMGPPTAAAPTTSNAGDWPLTFQVESAPETNIGITVYWW